MRIVSFIEDVPARLPDVRSAGFAEVALGSGSGEAHAYAVYFEPGGFVAPQAVGFAQLFIVTAGAGWVAGADGVRHPISSGQLAHFEKGEIHAKGSDGGMAAIMVQMSELFAQASMPTYLA